MDSHLYLNRTMEGSISKLSSWIHTPVTKKIVVYTGDFENTERDIKVINYKHLQEHLPLMI